MCPVLNALTLSRREPTSTRKQHGKGHADYLLAICQDSARARASVFLHARMRVCARVSVRVFTGRASERRGRSLTNIGFTHWNNLLLNNLPPQTAKTSPAQIAGTFLRSGKKPTHSLDTFFWILMPDLIIYLALLSGSLHSLFFGDERLRCQAQHICKVS